MSTRKTTKNIRKVLADSKFSIQSAQNPQASVSELRNWLLFFMDKLDIERSKNRTLRADIKKGIDVPEEFIETFVERTRQHRVQPVFVGDATENRMFFVFDKFELFLLVMQQKIECFLCLISLNLQNGLMREKTNEKN